MSISREERIARGNWAKALLEHPYFVAVCNGMVADSLQTLMSTEPGSQDAKAAHISLLSANNFKNALTAIKNDGTVASKG